MPIFLLLFFGKGLSFRFFFLRRNRTKREREREREEDHREIKLLTSLLLFCLAFFSEEKKSYA